MDVRLIYGLDEVGASAVSGAGAGMTTRIHSDRGRPSKVPNVPINIELSSYPGTKNPVTAPAFDRIKDRPPANRHLEFVLVFAALDPRTQATQAYRTYQVPLVFTGYRLLLAHGLTGLAFHLIGSSWTVDNDIIGGSVA